MTQLEAREALKRGEKLTHRFFEEGEFIYEKDGELYDEKDIALVHRVFWQVRWDGPWHDGWQLAEPDARTQLSEIAINSFGNPLFDAEKLHQHVYANCDTQDGSVLMLLNSIREISTLAKKLYEHPPKI